MGHDQRETSGSSGAVVAVLVAVLLILALGGMLVIGVGAYFWLRTARMATERALVAEHKASQMAQRAKAVAEAKIAEADAATRQAEALARIQGARASLTASDSQPDLSLNIGKDGSLSLDGEPIDVDGLQERLAELGDQSGTAVSVSLAVHPDCPAGDLQPVLTALEEARVSWRWHGTDR